MVISVKDFRILFYEKFFISIGFIAILFTTFVISGCVSVKLIGDYDETIDKSVTEIQQKTELYVAKLNSNPNTPFDQEFHDTTKASLAVLKTRASALPKYEIIVQSIDLLQKSFDDFRDLDKITSRPIIVGPDKKTVFTNALIAIEIQVGAILKLELALKRGDTPDTSKTPDKSNK